MKGTSTRHFTVTASLFLFFSQFFSFSFSHEMHSPTIIAMTVNAWTLLLVSALPMKNDLCTRLLLWKYAYTSSIRFVAKCPAEFSINSIDSKIWFRIYLYFRKNELVKVYVKSFFWLLIFVIIILIRDDYTYITFFIKRRRITKFNQY